MTTFKYFVFILFLVWTKVEQSFSDNLASSTEKPRVSIQLSGSLIEGHCRHSNLSSFSIFPCNSRENCDQVAECLERDELEHNCGKSFQGESCYGRSHGFNRNENCLTFPMEKVVDFAAISQCTGFTGNTKMTIVEPLIQTADLKWQTGQNTKSLMKFRVTQDINIIHHKRPVLYVGEHVTINCRVSRYVFPDKIQLVGIFRNGTKFPIARKKVDSTLYFLDIEKSFKILKDMVKISCSTSWYNSTGEWFKKVLEFSTAEPTVPVMERNKEMRFLNCNEFHELTINYSGGPLTMSKCFFKPQDSTELNDDTIPGHHIQRHSYGAVSSLVLTSKSLTRGVGTYSCYLGNQLGTRSSLIHVAIMEVHGSSDAVNVLENNSRSHGQTSCQNGFAWHGQTGQCYEVGTKGPCTGDMMAFNKISLDSNQSLNGECGCQNLLSSKKCQNNKTVFWKGTGQCYKLHSKGPCKDFNYLKLDENGELVCKKDDTDDRSIGGISDDVPCPPDTKEDGAGNCIDHIEFE